MGQVVRGPLSTAKRAKGGSKKKNAGVGVDFKRIKHKVGKKLKKAQNETVTTFKSASGERRIPPPCSIKIITLSSCHFYISAHSCSTSHGG